LHVYSSKEAIECHVQTCSRMKIKAMCPVAGCIQEVAMINIVPASPINQNYGHDIVDLTKHECASETV